VRGFVESSKSSRFAGFTLLEFSVVIVVIAILVVLLIPVISSIRARGQRVQCMANLRSLYTGAELFIQQNGSWPQIPVGDDSDTAEQDYAKAWIAALAPFGPTQKTWICPTIQTLMHNPDLSRPENVRTDYAATTFDDKPTTPHQWRQQPWFAEVGDVHGNGNLIIFTDGSISDLKTVAARGAGSH
jgi:prepilin-type N-terminal cleavage/methylation domain-containing protein